MIDFDNFSNISQLKLNGNTTKANDALSLTASVRGQRGSAFYERALAIDADTSFATQFQFQILGGTTGADGFTFMLQNDLRGLNALGGGGGNLGYGNIDNSLAIEFDPLRNTQFEPLDNHISVLQDGSVANYLAIASAPFDLNSGDILSAWIDYNGKSDLLEIYLANTLNKPNISVLSFNIDLAAVVGQQAFLGFSAATGGKSNNHNILNWEFSTNSTLLAPTPSSNALKSETIVAGLNLPTAIDWSPGGDTLFIAEKAGIVKVSRNGQLLPTPFIDLSTQVNDVRDRGLLDIAVHPDFYNGSPYVYALYTYDPIEVFQYTGLAGPDGEGNRAARLTRITADAKTNFTKAVPGSEVTILGTNSTWNNFNAFVNSTNDFAEAPAGILPDGTNLRDFLAADSETHTPGSVEFGPDGALHCT